MDRREFIKKVGGAGVAVMAGVGLIAATAPKYVGYIAGADALPGSKLSVFKLTLHEDWYQPEYIIGIGN